MKRKSTEIFKRIVAIVFVAIVACQIAFAAYSKQGTFKLKGNDQPWTNTTTSGTRLTQRKMSDSGFYLVKATAKTMSSTPKFCIIGTDNVIYSKMVDLQEVNHEYRGVNTAQKYWYMSASLKASVFQYGDDTISVKFDPK